MNRCCRVRDDLSSVRPQHADRRAAFEKMRVYRPRLVLHGEPGMGQNFIGPAVLQSLEGFHVQSIDLSTLVSDSSKVSLHSRRESTSKLIALFLPQAAEAAIVDVFTEAKRHKPSILYIPNLLLWATSVSDLVKATFKGLLDAIDPSEPILLMAVVDGLLNSVPSDVRGWFGFVKSNRVLLERPSAV